MFVARDYGDWPASLRGGVVAIGNFDGLHRGHQAVIARLLEMAQDRQAPAIILTFEPHPRRYFQVDSPPLLLQGFAQKARQLRDMGAAAILAQRFNGAFSQLSAQDFIDTVLVNALGVNAVLTGQEFVFGQGRTGNAALLQKAAQQGQFAYESLAPLGNSGEGKYSSSKVREHLRQGEMALAVSLLGAPYRWTRRVIHGEKRGRSIGFPTANILPPPLMLPRYGVYAVRCAWQGKPFTGVANLGVRPTVGGNHPLLEVHLLDCDADLYGQSLQVDFIAHLRDEQRFDGLDALKVQIAHDVAQAREMLAV